GTGKDIRSLRSSAPLRATITAFSLSTSTTARRSGTTHNGSKLALSKSALPKRCSSQVRGAGPGRRILPARARPTTPWFRHLSTPLEVGHEVQWVGPDSRSAARRTGGGLIGAVLSLEPEPEVLAIGHREERRAPPP